jgi:hypothetical protein
MDDGTIRLVAALAIGIALIWAATIVYRRAKRRAGGS